jgi:uncharacterized repeat protein (TIGR03803 family)
VQTSLCSTTGLRLVFASLTVALLATARPAGAQETILLSFNGTSDGRRPEFPVVLDAAGNLYGTTTIRGAHGFGTAFELSPNGSGGFTETVLYSFGGTSTDGKTPSSGLILDSSGNLFGTTSAGGVSGVGTVYELSPDGNGGRTETVLYSFKNDGMDGVNPFGNLTQDAAGNLYGTTQAGGSGTNALGVVYELKHKSSGWVERVLHTFVNDAVDGIVPASGLIFDAGGNLYGVTGSGGATGFGTVYEMKPQTSGKWIERVIHSFNDNGTDGFNPFGRLTLDSAGNLYGTTVEGGTHTFGAFFEMKLKGGIWTERVLYSFNGGIADGQQPSGGLIFDAAGNLYGTTGSGGSGGRGTLFELSPHVNGSWTESLLHSFVFNGTDGIEPNTALIMDAAGNLYGTTSQGGVGNNGTVFEFTP